MKKRSIIVCGIIIVILCISGFVYADSKINIFSNYFDNPNENQQLMIKDNQYVEYDGYIISLDSYSYNNDTMDGCCLFTIAQVVDGGNEKLGDYADSNGVYGVCENNRFYFSFLGSGSTAMVPENNGDILNVYFYFSVADIVEEEKNCIHLYDTKAGDLEPAYTFYISGIGESKKTEFDNGEIIVSSLGVLIKSTKAREIDSLSVIQDGIKLNMVEKGITRGNCYVTEYTSEMDYVFKCKTSVILDIKKVTAIELNGQLYNVN